ncbi:aldose 1-epimerase family protein [Flavobacterium selenitireducens]|uniref:aldose 1-epimerase family protein n=1 Tax=Flavobacterium selenitireducens TaxID=2722704 RepID=UPI00168AEE82|nr:aldose 1-epimerase family protein [Flavobacterium selenitireducens]MBD3582977.1 aldose 1-epimerase family protein [Flavobacterium selenitireducens]
MKKTLSHNGFSATIDYHGAELVSFKSPDGTEYIWNGDPQFWGKHSPVLFPIVGTLKNNGFTYKGAHFQLGRHGFARDMEFSLTHHSDNQAVFSLQFSAETLEKYPFRFWLQINYRLMDNKLLIGYSVINEGTGKMPFSLGAHPAFALAGNFTDYSLKFEKGASLRANLLENDLLSDTIETLPLENRRLALDYSLFEKDALVLKNIAAKSVSILRLDKRVVTVGYDDFPHLGLWTKPGAPFLCIEPWFGYSDTTGASGNISEKESMMVLESEAVFNTNFTIEVF